MALIKDLSQIELSVQWHAFQARIDRLEKRLNRMHTHPTKKDLMNVLQDRHLTLKDQLLDAMNLQESVEYWLRNRGTTQEQIDKWHINPRYERFDNYPKT
jgi:hypothetical protein